jgi:hypothetical protein
VSLDDAFDDGESKSRTATLAFSRLPEPVKDVREVGCDDAGPCVPDLEHHFRLPERSRLMTECLNAAPIGTITDRDAAVTW